MDSRSSNTTIPPSPAEKHAGFPDELASTTALARKEPPILVDWNGPDDPEMPLNWPLSRRCAHVAVASALSLLTPLASSMLAPGVPSLLAEFHSDSKTLSSFVVSVYVLGVATGPLVIGPLCEHFGRLPLYYITNVLFVVFTIACALATSLDMLIGMRFLAGCAGAAPYVLGAGTVADLFRAEARGKVMAVYTLGVLLGPVVGPIAGGFISDNVGWRWSFWAVAVAGGVISLTSILVLRESYAPILLYRKMVHLQKSAPPNTTTYTTPFADSSMPTSALFKRAIVRPMKILIFSPTVLILSIYVAVTYGYVYLIYSTITFIFEEKYRFSPSIVGLSFIGSGIGMAIGLIAFAALSDKLMKERANKAAAAAAASTEGNVETAGELKPEYRLYLMILPAFAIPIGLFWYGWSVEKGVYWVMPMIGTALFGFGMVGTYMPIVTYIVDAYPVYSASATAANLILRCVFAAILPIAGEPLYSALGLGWGNSLLAFIVLLGCAVPFLFIRHGEYLRTSPKFKVEF